MSSSLFSSSREARAYAEEQIKRPLAGFPDLLVLAPEGKTAQHSIESVREAIALSYLPPHEGPFRLVLIEEADRLGVVASNALLKTLEEPSPHTLFLLVSTKPLLPTLASRCRKIRSPEETLIDERLQAQVRQMVAARDSFPRLVEEIARLELLLEEKRGNFKLSREQKDTLALATQEKLVRQSEGEEYLDFYKARRQVAEIILQEIKNEGFKNIGAVDEKLQEMLLRSERMAPFAASLEAFFLEYKYLKLYN